ncbi:MAG: hypothetical protein ABDH21_00695 [bacterium]
MFEGTLPQAISELQILEPSEYYTLPDYQLNQHIYFFDGVKEIVYLNQFYEALWITCIGGIRTIQQPCFTKVFCFYVYNYVNKPNNYIFDKLSTYGISFNSVFEEFDQVYEYVTSVKDLSVDYVLGLSQRVEYEKIESIQSFTNQMMLYLEALIVNRYLNHVGGVESIVVSDGPLSKFNKIPKMENTLTLVGLVKQVEKNYLANLGNEYLYNLPFSKRTASFLIKYGNIHVISFYLNLGLYSPKIIRLEILKGSDEKIHQDIQRLERVANVVLKLSVGPRIYHRMPENNLALNTLEKYLKKYIPHQTIFSYVF